MTLWRQVEAAAKREPIVCSADLPALVDEDDAITPCRHRAQRFRGGLLPCCRCWPSNQLVVPLIDSLVGSSFSASLFAGPPPIVQPRVLMVRVVAVPEEFYRAYGMAYWWPEGREDQLGGAGFFRVLR